MGICGISMDGGFGMTTLVGDAGGWYSWGWRIGRRIERGWVRMWSSDFRPSLDFLVERVYC